MVSIARLGVLLGDNQCHDKIMPASSVKLKVLLGYIQVKFPAQQIYLILKLLIKLIIFLSSQFSTLHKIHKLQVVTTGFNKFLTFKSDLNLIYDFSKRHDEKSRTNALRKFLVN